MFEMIPHTCLYGVVSQNSFGINKQTTNHPELSGCTHTEDVRRSCPISGHTEHRVVRVSHNGRPHHQLVMSAVVSGSVSVVMERGREGRCARSAIGLFVCALVA